MKRMLRTSEYARYSERDFDNFFSRAVQVSAEQIRWRINLTMIFRLNSQDSRQPFQDRIRDTAYVMLKCPLTTNGMHLTNASEPMSSFAP